jgi:RHS repeat-associated protein
MKTPARFARWIVSPTACLGLLLVLPIAPRLLAEDAAPEATPTEINPTTNTDVSTIITTGGGYDAWTGSVRRVIHDIYSVPGAVGYGHLAYTRTYSSHYTTEGGALGDEREWSGSYSWQAYGAGSVYGGLTIFYPDGRQEAFTHTQEGDNFMRGARGTKDRVNFFWGQPDQSGARIGWVDLYLEDGSIVHFYAYSSYIGPGDPPSILYADYVCQYVLDPNGLQTNIEWEIYQNGDAPKRRLHQVTDPTGRNLTFQYVSASSPVLTRVDASDGQYVIYTSTGSGASKVQTSTYSDGTSATYTYVHTTTTTGGRDRVRTANDTHAEGPMRGITYNYLADAQPKFGGQIDFEGSYPGNVRVSTYVHSGNTITETRGDGAFTRSFDIQKDNNTPLMYSKTDFAGHREYFHYNANRFLDQWTDFRGSGTGDVAHTTIYQNEPILGRPLTITHPPSASADPFSYGTSSTTYSYEDPAHPEPQFPYFVYSIRDDRGQVTTYDRFPRIPQAPDMPQWKQRIKTITYPDIQVDSTYPTETFVYDRFGQVTRHKLKNGYYQHARFDNVTGLLMELWNPSPSDTLPNEPHYIYAYYTSGAWKDRVQTITNPLGNSETYTYDHKFDGAGNPTTIACPGRGLVTRITYNNDAHGSTSSTSKQFVYDIYGNKVSETNEAGEETTYEYDDYNRLTKVTKPFTNGQTSETKYYFNRYSGLVAVADPLTHTHNAAGREDTGALVRTINVYDQNFRLSSTTKGTGTQAATTQFAYDANGNQVTVTDPKLKSTTVSFDSRNRKTRMVSPEVHLGINNSTITQYTSEWQYDAANNVTDYHRPDGKWEHGKLYDAMNRLTWDYDPMGRRTRFTYYASGTLRSVTDANDHITYFEYDKRFDLKSRMIYPRVTDTQEWAYDANKNLIERTTVNGTKQSFGYDARNRKIWMRWDNSVDWSDFGYDVAGRLNYAFNPYSTITRQYDGGYLSSETQTLPALASLPISAVQVQQAWSRRYHGAVFYDIVLPLSGTPGVECRTGTTETIVVAFWHDVTVAGATIVSGNVTGVVSKAVNGRFVTLTVPGVANAQTIVVKLVGVRDETTNDYDDVLIPMSVVIGDSTGNGSVNSSDITQISTNSGSPIGNTNFRCDLNTSGMINAGDVNIAKTFEAGLPPTFDSLPTKSVNYAYNKDGKVARIRVLLHSYDYDQTYDTLGRLELIYPDNDVPHTLAYHQYYYDLNSNVTERKNWRENNIQSYSSTVRSTPDEINRVKDLAVYVPSQIMPNGQRRNFITNEHYGYDGMNRLKYVSREEDNLNDVFGYNDAGELTSALYGTGQPVTARPPPSLEEGELGGGATPTPTPMPQLPPVEHSEDDQTDPMHVTLTCPGAAKIFYTTSEVGYDDPDAGPPQHDSDGRAIAPTQEYVGPVAVPPGKLLYFQAVGYAPGNDDSDNEMWLESNADYSENGIFHPDSTEVNPGVLTTYHLDNCGNRTGSDGCVVGGVPCAYDPNELNQYDTVCGNFVGNGSEHELNEYAGVGYTYLGDTYLSQVMSPTDTYKLGYDALGRCVRRTFNNIRTYIIYDGERPIMEFDGNAGVTASNVYGAGVDEIIKRTSGIGEYMIPDRLGNIVAVAGATGAPLEWYRYDAFGTPTIFYPADAAFGRTHTTSNISNRFLFTGREYAEKFGFYEYRARAYNPTLGRFMSEDPKLFDAKDYNLYRYCANDPLDKTDPMGLFTYQFDDSYPEADRPTAAAALDGYKATGRGKQLSDQSPHLVIKVIPADATHKTAAVGTDKLRLDPKDPALLDPQTRRNFQAHPGELPPSDAKGRIVTVGHEVGHLVTNQKDESKAGPDNHNVRDNENPVRKDLGLPDRKTYDGVDVNKPKNF